MLEDRTRIDPLLLRLAEAEERLDTPDPAHIAALLLATPALGQTALPDPARTPGALNPEVTETTIRSTICVRGWTQTIRPSQAYTSALKRDQIRAFGYADRRMNDYHRTSASTRWFAATGPTG